MWKAKNRGFSGKGKGFSGFMVENWGFSGKMRFLGMYEQKSWFFWWKNRGFIEKWGFRGFLINKSGKSREEPGI